MAGRTGKPSGASRVWCIMICAWQTAVAKIMWKILLCRKAKNNNSGKTGNVAWRRTMAIVVKWIMAGNEQWPKIINVKWAAAASFSMIMSSAQSVWQRRMSSWAMKIWRRNGAWRRNNGENDGVSGMVWRSEQCWQRKHENGRAASASIGMAWRRDDVNMGKNEGVNNEKWCV